MLRMVRNNFFNGVSCSLFDDSIAQDIHNFHKTIPHYCPTPLINLSDLASKIGLGDIYVKDESQRFGLNAFKVLGGTYAIAKIAMQNRNIKTDNIEFEHLLNDFDKPIIFATATAGNHGTGIAWAAHVMKQQAVIYMPKGVAQASVQRARNLGAKVIVTNVNYDDTVSLAAKDAKVNGWILVQDTAWEGYTQIPTWISQGYMTMAREVIVQMTKKNMRNFFTHVFLQAGVGAMAGGVLGYFVDALAQYNFKAIIVEPASADCLYRSSQTQDGGISIVSEGTESIMAGLACGVPNPVTWEVLRNNSHFFVATSDDVATKGMDLLKKPTGADTMIDSGPSGAVTMGALYRIMTEEKYKPIAQHMGLDASAKVLIFNTEASFTDTLQGA